MAQGAGLLQSLQEPALSPFLVSRWTVRNGTSILGFGVRADPTARGLDPCLPARCMHDAAAL